MKIQRMVILGVGLIGGSLALALRRARVCRNIAGVGRHEANLEKAVRLRVIDESSLRVGPAVADADIVVIATPLSSYAGLLRQIAGAAGDDTIITDVGSVKGSAVAAARGSLGRHFPRFVPGHPIAGKEKSGVEAASADLFRDHRVILTPLAETSVRAVSTVTAMWEACGARVMTMPVEGHDSVLAATSHLPHALAYALVDCLAGMPEHEEIFQFAAGGFIDFTRIASSSPQMWHDICLANRDSLLTALAGFDRHLGELRRAVQENDSDTILRIFTRAKSARDALVDGRRGAAEAEDPR